MFLFIIAFFQVSQSLAMMSGSTTAETTIIGKGGKCGFLHPGECDDGLVCNAAVNICEDPNVLTKAGEGQSCGGLYVGKYAAGLCASDLFCVGNEFDPDSSGECRKEGPKTVGVGQACGGVKDPSICEPNLMCDTTKAINSDSLGVCKQNPNLPSMTTTETLSISTATTDSIPTTKARNGEPCGGYTQFPIECEIGLSCIFPDQDSNTPQAADSQGVCKKILEKGDACLTEKDECAPGLRCMRRCEKKRRKCPKKLHARGFCEDPISIGPIKDQSNI